ncbi:MAG: hypothetical protein R3352_07610 [Salinisphaeraceae bacterium]|nr:hypothetical protein [Salinisphaeraceae bacterium]
MFKKLSVFTTSLMLALGTATSVPALADPKLPDLPDPGDLPKPPSPEELPGMDEDDGTWWDPLGIFADDDDDDDHPHGHKPPGHEKHKGKGHKHKD